MKLDLHTHCFEATLSGSLSTVDKIVKSVKACGLDGIAITEHIDKTYGYHVRDIVDQYFDNEVLIIPGQEANTPLVYVQIVELYLSDNATFRFVVHPYHVMDIERYLDLHANELHGIEIGNFQHKWEMEHAGIERIQRIAEKYDLMTLTNSDAHDLKNIGKFYNEIDLEDLHMKIGEKAGLKR